MAPLSGLHKSSLPSDFEAPAEPELLGSISPIRPTRSRRQSRRRDDHDGRCRSRRGKRAWKKLLWVKQSYPDNYTDQATFLENLQRNPRLQPYEFWPLVADSTVIVQHVCSIIIFVACFVGIFQERVSPVSVVSWGSFATFAGWVLWDWWVGQEAAADAIAAVHAGSPSLSPSPSPSLGSQVLLQLPGQIPGQLPPQHREANRLGTGAAENPGSAPGRHLPVSTTVGLTTSAGNASNAPSAGSSTSNLHLAVREREREQMQRYCSTQHAGPSKLAAPGPLSRHRPSSPLRGGRSHLRINAMKSALLIYFTLLGLSPILKSLTRSTSSDSIWAMSLWLLAINVFFFDYSGAWVGVSNISVPSLSTNAALMASTVLASRLPSTGQVFSLTLFSIEVFGLFPVFRRYARHRSWRYHVLLTMLLVLGAGGGVAITLTGPSADGRWPWRSGLLGMLLGCVVAALAMGGCSWWLLGLQKYKNEIYGPWDPARPIIISRRHWDEE